MTFLTSPSATICVLVALTAITFSPGSLIFAFAKPLLPTKESNDNKSLEENNGNKSSSSPPFEVPAVPPFHSSPDNNNNNNNGSASLVGLNPTKLLTKAEAAFFQEALRNIFNIAVNLKRD